MSGEQLAWMVTSGDVRSLEELYDRYVRQCFSLAYRMLGVAESAEATTHDVFTELLNNPSAYSARGEDIVGWLLNETHSRCIRILRSQTRDASVAIELRPDPASLPNSIYTDSRELEGPAVRVPQYASTHHAPPELQHLPQDHRQALELAYFEGLSQQEIATRLGQSQETVARYFREGLNVLEA